MDWKSIVRTVAPTIAGTFGTPLMGMAVKFAADALLPADKVAELKNAPAKLESAVKQAVLAASPEDLAKIKQADADLEAKLAELGVRLEEIHAQDRASAREREVAVGDRTPRNLAYLLIALLALLVALPVFNVFTIPDPFREIYGGAIGTVSTLLAGAKDYFFGSSSGSSAKNRMLEKVLDRGAM